MMVKLKKVLKMKTGLIAFKDILSFEKYLKLGGLYDGV